MLECDITYEIEDLEEFFDENKITEFTNFILKEEYGDEYYKNDYYLSLLIANDKIIKEINKEYRNKDCTTDVISFA